jgi:hypothetical protein
MRKFHLRVCNFETHFVIFFVSNSENYKLSVGNWYVQIKINILTFFFQKKDAKDRLLKAETEGIVLSPQRRSFITGCQVAKAEPPNPETTGFQTSQTSINKPDSLSLRPDTSRRVGSGRLLNRGERPPVSDHSDYENRNRNAYDTDRYGFNNRDRNNRGNDCRV